MRRKASDEAKCRRGILVCDCCGEPGEGVSVGEPENPGHPFGVHPSLAEGGNLLQQAQRVPDRAASIGGDHCQAIGSGVEPFSGGDLGHVGPQDLGGHRVEVKPLGPASDRVEQLVRLGGGEDEDDMLRWFLEGLEQGVSRGTRQHVCLIEDVHAVGSGGSGDGADVDADLPHVLDLVVGCGVKLDDVKRRALGDRHTRCTFVVRLAVRAAIGAVQRLGEKTGRGGLAGAPRAGEQIGVGDLVIGDLAQQCVNDVVLANYLGELLRAVLAVESLVAHWDRG